MKGRQNFWKTGEDQKYTGQNAITEGDLECILTRNCEGTEQLRINKKQERKDEKNRNYRSNGT